MRHPLEFIPADARKPLFFTFLILTLTLLAIFQVLDKELPTDAAPNGILSFELAGNPETARAITDSWKHMRLWLGAASSLGIDYVFMPIYALALAFGSLLAMHRHEGWIRSLGAVAAYAGFAAATFDAVENYALLRVLLGEVQSSYPAIAAFCAILKFGLILFGALYGLAAWLLPKR
jgi:hypothetical protein